MFKKRGLILTLTHFALILVSIFILAFRIFYPYHRRVALTLYVLSWLFLALPLLYKKTRNHIKKNPKYTFVHRHIFTISGILTFLFVLYALIIIFPAAETSLSQTDITQLNTKLDQDRIYLLQLLTSAEKNIHTIEQLQLSTRTLDNTPPQTIEEIHYQ